MMCVETSHCVTLFQYCKKNINQENHSYSEVCEVGFLIRDPEVFSRYKRECKLLTLSKATKKKALTHWDLNKMVHNLQTF